VDHGNQNAAAVMLARALAVATSRSTVTIRDAREGSESVHAASTIDPKRLYEAGTELAWSIALGSTQYNRRTFCRHEGADQEGPGDVAGRKHDGHGAGAAAEPDRLTVRNDEVIDTWD
jgi:hypothetical protein